MNISPQNETPCHARLLLAGKPGSELRRAADLARQSGAQVTQADSIPDAIARARGEGGDLAMVDVALDIEGFIAALRAERIAMPVIACGIDAAAERAVAAIHAGARDYVPLPPDRDLIAAAITSVTARAVTMVGAHPAFVRATDYARAMARANAPMTVRGEEGTGKELVARNIHRASGRAGPFIAVECEGVAPDILESELFGHEAGAFPAAVAARTGRMEEAGDGTLYVREVAALPPVLQARLANAMIMGRIEPVGGGRARPLRARILAGSRMDLRTLVREGAFRADLFHRLGLVEVTVPPLRDRGDDIAHLARHFVREHALENGLAPPDMEPATLALLARHDWPGNVRELEQVMHRAVLLAAGRAIAPAMLVLADGVSMGMALNASRVVTAGEDHAGDPLVGRAVADVERDLILATLNHCGGNRTSASSILGISVRTMRNKLREFAQAGYRI